MITEQQIANIVRREVGEVKIENVVDRDDYRLHVLANREHLFIRKSDGWGWIGAPDERGAHQTKREFGPI